jgi:hypothetical protein
LSKPACIHVDQIEWAQPECSDNPAALGAHANGYDFEVAPSADAKGKFDWLVRVTAEISEQPEVIATGTASSVSGAKRGGGNAANADRRRRFKEAPASKPNPVVDPISDPADMPAANPVEKVEQALGAEMAAKEAVPAVRMATPKKRTRKQPQVVAA